LTAAFAVAFFGVLGFCRGLRSIVEARRFAFGLLAGRRLPRAFGGVASSSGVGVFAAGTTGPKAAASAAGFSFAVVSAVELRASAEATNGATVLG